MDDYDEDVYDMDEEDFDDETDEYDDDDEGDEFGEYGSGEDEKFKAEPDVLEASLRGSLDGENDAYSGGSRYSGFGMSVDLDEMTDEEREAYEMGYETGFESGKN